MTQPAGKAAYPELTLVEDTQGGDDVRARLGDNAREHDKKPRRFRFGV